MRLSVLIIGALTVLAVSCQHSPGSRASITTQSMTTQQVLARHIAASGGAAAFEHLHSVRYKVEITEPQFTVTGDYRASRDGRMRIDI